MCSCTIAPLFAGVYRKGAGIGPAMTFLFFAPAANILALVYTGGVIGPDLAVARLLVGTPKLGIFTGAHPRLEIPIAGTDGWQAFLDRLVPYDAAKGEEGPSVQGLALIGLQAAIGITAWRGLENVHEAVTLRTRTCLALAATTLLFAALALRRTPEVLRVGFTGRFFGAATALGAIHALARDRLSDEELRGWLWESFRFVRQIFPLLVIGVFAAGMMRVLIRPEWIEAIAGTNSIGGNLAGVAFGVFMYFPTLVEVPVTRMFLEPGMHRGPLLAYLMWDPELSLQSILIIAAIIGKARTGTYVALVAVLSAAAGLTCGA